MAKLGILWDINVTLDLLQIFNRLRNLTAFNYIVGGCVRDSLMGVNPLNFDIVTNAPMDDVHETFSNLGWDEGPGSPDLLFLHYAHEGRHYEIANFRKDGCYSNALRYLSQKVGSLEEDAAKRDFTVNALYMDPFSGQIIDPNGQGKSDLEHRILRFIGDPEERIREDWTRVLRFYRFLGRGFIPDQQSLHVCQKLFHESCKHIESYEILSTLENIVL